MSKAIAVFDMPKGCMQCPCMYVSDYDGECHCAITRESVEEYGEGKVGSKPKWCPLKPMPIRMSVRDELSDKYNLQDNPYCQGWNACLNTIVGDEDE